MILEEIPSFASSKFKIFHKIVNSAKESAV